MAGCRIGQAWCYILGASRSGTIHVAKARVGDLGPGRGRIRPLALTQKTVVTQRRHGGIQSRREDLRWRTMPARLATSRCRYVPELFVVPGGHRANDSAGCWTPRHPKTEAIIFSALLGWKRPRWPRLSNNIRVHFYRKSSLLVDNHP